MARAGGRRASKRKSYYVKKRLLSVRGAVLLHLLQHYRAQWPGNMPYAVSQEGVAEGVEGHRGHVSRILRDLIKEGLVFQNVGRVDGIPTRVKAYHLTEEGAREAVRIADRVRATPTEVVGEDRPVPMSELEARYAGRGRLLDLALHTDRRRFDPEEFEEWLESREEYVAHTKRMPVLRQFFGREEELDRLERWYDSGAAHTMVITGIAGIGKTSLASKFLADRKASTNVFWYTVEEWSSLSNFLRALADFDSALGVHGLNAHVRSRKNPSIEESLLLLERELRGRKAVLVVDDVHKAGERIVHFLKGFIQSLPRCSGPKMVLVGREIPDLYDRRDVRVRDQVREMELGGLDEGASAQLLRSKGIPEVAVPEILEVTKGHPFFLELFEEGADLAKGDFRRFLREEIYEALAEGEARVLSAASLYRTPVFSQGLLLDEDTSFSDVVALVKRGLLKETASGQYEVHDLLKEYLAGAVAPVGKRRYHEAAAEYYRILGDEISNLEAIHHYLEAGEETSAVELAVARGRGILDHGTSSELLKVLDRVLSVGPGGEDLAELALVKSEAAYQAGNLEDALEACELALAISEEVRNEYKAAEALRRMGRIHLERSDHETATDLLMASLQVSRRVKDLLGLAETYGELGKLYMRIGPYSKAKRHIDLSLKWAEKSRDKTATGKGLLLLASLERKRGKDLERALSLTQGALEFFEEEGKVYEMARATHSMALALGAMDEYESAVHCFQRSLELTKKCGSVLGQACALQGLASLRISKSDLEGVEPMLEEALEILTRLKHRRRVALLHLCFAGLYQGPEDWDLSMKHIDKSLNELRALGEWGDLVRALTYKGQVLNRVGRPSDARATFEKALEVSDRIADARTRANILREARSVIKGSTQVDLATLG
jgi:tetratricopeptide (TPR) repeat protein